MVPVRAAAISAGQPAREREDRAGDRHRDEEEAVGAAAAETVAVAGKQHGDERGARKQSGERNADLRGGQAASGERDTDQHRAEPVGEGPRSLPGDDPACIGAQVRSSNTAAPPLPGQKT